MDGMCGGPVCDELLTDYPSKVAGLENNAFISSKFVRGMVEGIVPRDFPSIDLRDAAVFVESGEIRRFLQDIEEGKVKPLEGGAAMEFVGKNSEHAQDVTKLWSIHTDS